ncbi:MAG: nuclear transport factor 2 family protein [Halioglobus sp.]
MSDTIQRWHEMMASGSMEGLEEILDPDCVFLSPVVHTPQEGRDITMLYLSGASQVLGNNFKYVKEVVTPTHAVLEFECEVDEILVNGVDIMTFNEAGKITEFKVMVRPLKAVNKVHAQMKAMLEKLSG